MMYAGVLRRGDGFYPLNAIMQNFVILCIIWQGIDWLRQRRFVRGALAAATPLLWPFCIVALLTLFPKNSGRTDWLCRVGVGHHRAAAFVDIHHRWRLVPTCWAALCCMRCIFHKRLRLCCLGGCNILF